MEWQARCVRRVDSCLAEGMDVLLDAVVVDFEDLQASDCDGVAFFVERHDVYVDQAGVDAEGEAGIRRGPACWLAAAPGVLIGRSGSEVATAVLISAGSAEVEASRVAAAAFAR